MEKSNNKNRISWQFWLVIWVAGIAGQLVWNIENQWFNTFVYDKIAPNPNIITWMVAISAIASTFSTFLCGTLSDRIGKRRIFVLLGYIMWGSSTIVFGLTQFTIGILGVTGAAIMVVIADAIMSFFGSMGNDCGFSTWTTDITNPHNRGTLGTALAVQPVIATVVGSLLFGAIISGFSDFKINGQTLDYFMMFVIAGIAIIIIGIVSYFLIKESPTLIARKDDSFAKSMAKPFDFKLLKKNRLMVYVLLTFMLFFISFNVYFPHILNYFIYGTSKDTLNWVSTSLFGNENSVEMIAGGLLAIGLLLAFPLVIFCGKILNKQKFILILFLSVIVNVIGLLIMFIGGISGVKYGGELAIILIGIFFVGAGYMCLYQALMVWIKNLYPEDMRSRFEGIRMLFYVCIPMFLGTLVGNVIVQNMGNEIVLVYERGEVTGFAPNYWLFIIAAGLALLTFIPITLAYFEIKKRPPVYVDE